MTLFYFAMPLPRLEPCMSNFRYMYVCMYVYVCWRVRAVFDVNSQFQLFDFSYIHMCLSSLEKSERKRERKRLQSVKERESKQCKDGGEQKDRRIERELN